MAADGRGLLVLLPSEKEAMVKLLTEAKIPIQATKINPSKTGQSLAPALQALLSKSPELKVRRQLGVHATGTQRGHCIHILVYRAFWDARAWACTT